MPYKQLTQFFGSKPNTPLLAHSATLVFRAEKFPKTAKFHFLNLNLQTVYSRQLNILG